MPTGPLYSRASDCLSGSLPAHQFVFLEGEKMNLDDENMEPLDEIEQAMLDRLRMIEGPQGCHWVDDVGQYCNKSLAQLPSRLSYCEEHLCRSLTEAGWRRMMTAAGRAAELQVQEDA